MLRGRVRYLTTLDIQAAPPDGGGISGLNVIGAALAVIEFEHIAALRAKSMIASALALCGENGAHTLPQV